MTVACPGADGVRAVLIQAQRPDGTAEESWRQVVIVDRVAATVRLPVAYNDPRGTWTVSATELFSNRETQLRLKVE